MLNIWGRTIDPKTYSNALTINGRSWPYTERITATVGDTLRWRVINATARNHPMHLHGFYYRVDSRGDIAADTTYSPENRRLVVTEGLQPLTTLTMDWSPDRPGNWLYHCHVGFHVLPDARINPVAASSLDRMAHDPRVHMAGLVLESRSRLVRVPPSLRSPRRASSASSSRKDAAAGGRRAR